ncbi:diacylglycerol kinase [Bacillus thuringiensis]|uniref:dihydrofolate reductase family protein n=1 Tax=Bacillus cereus group TaxID=86661 RepID=UPI00137537BA|nr:MULTISPECIES: dihydrofolate reductase family protein [Bacillus cereus group]MBG9465132.1 diacylglycerol kinase [Bacillus thuringiensis]
MKQERKIILFIGTSIDGYIANEDGNLDWLESTETTGDTGYATLLERIDTVVMGKNTYDSIRGFDMDYPYANYTNYVFSSSMEGKDEYAQFTKENVKTFITNLKKQPGQDIWLIGGGKLAHEFFKENLIDEFQLAIAPIILGKGISLYTDNNITTEFRLKKIEQFDQLAMLHYVKK